MANKVAVKTDKVTALVTELKGSYESGMPTHAVKEAFSRALMTQFRKIPKLMNCSRQSIGSAVVTAAQLGLNLGINGAAWLIPFGQECTLIIGYQGLVDLCYRSDKVESVRAEIVYENDEFEHEEGLNPILRHKKTLTGNRGKFIATYAIANLKDSSTPVYVVLTKEDVMAVKKSSKAAKSSDSPWNGPFESEMWKKTAIKRLSKVLPKSTELNRALQYEQDFEAKEVRCAKPAEVVSISDVMSGEAVQEPDTRVAEDTTTPTQKDTQQSGGNLFPDEPSGSGEEKESAQQDTQPSTDDSPEKDGCLSVDQQNEIESMVKDAKVHHKTLMSYLQKSLNVHSGKLIDVPAGCYQVLKMWIPAQAKGE